MTSDRTTIQISVELWEWLNGRKRPGESFDDVLRRELPVGAERASADGGEAETSTDETGPPTAEGRDADGSDGGDGSGSDSGSAAVGGSRDRAWYRCGYCGKVFEVPGALVTHVEESHSEATIHTGMGLDHDVIETPEGSGYYCPDCDLSFDAWDEFAEHNEREHGSDEVE